MDTLPVGINKLELKAGDVLVVKINHHYPPTADEINRISDIVQASLPDGVQGLVITKEFDLAVLRDGTPLTPDVDAPALVAGG